MRKWSPGRAGCSHEHGEKGPGFGTAEATEICEAGGHRGGSCAEGVPRTLCGRRNGLHMHREELRKAYQRRYYKGESGPEILEIEEFWKVLEFWPSQSVDVFLAPGDPVRTSERRNNLE